MSWEDRVEKVGLIGRNGWSCGPWDGEPDRVEWEHNGIPCAINRSDHGALCGYAAVNPNHPLHSIDYGRIEYGRPLEQAAHGELTFSELGKVCRFSNDPTLWWFGFDCGHAGDRCPGLEARSRAIGLDPRSGGRTDIYRDLAYVRGCVEAMADALSAVTSTQDEIRRPA